MLFFDLIERGGPVMYFLLTCSLISVAIMIERAVFWILEKRRTKMQDMESFCGLVDEGHLDEAFLLAQSTRNPILQRISSLLHQGNKAHLIEVFELELNRITDRTSANLRGLDTIVAIAPLLGILGTILGIMQSFNALGDSMNTNPQAVGDGLSEALLTTAIGLIIAVPSLVVHNFFVSIANKHVARLEQYAEELAISLNAKPDASSIDPSAMLHTISEGEIAE